MRDILAQAESAGDLFCYYKCLQLVHLPMPAEEEPIKDEVRRYVWPRYMLAFLGLGVSITCIWMAGMAWPKYEREFFAAGLIVLFIWIIGANIVVKRKFNEYRLKTGGAEHSKKQ